MCDNDGEQNPRRWGEGSNNYNTDNAYLDTMIKDLIYIYIRSLLLLLLMIIILILIIILGTCMRPISGEPEALTNKKKNPK